MTDEELRAWYFDWLLDIIFYNTRTHKDTMYHKLICQLHNIPFSWCIEQDRNRAEDGISLRNQFIYLNNLDEYRASTLIDSGPCTVLEVMVALAIRCEDIMLDPFNDDQTSKWFWEMIHNLGLENMTNRAYNENLVDDIIYRFMDRNYASDGTGGLFWISNCTEDLRDVDIWTQLNWYLCSKFE